MAVSISSALAASLFFVTLLTLAQEESYKALLFFQLGEQLSMCTELFESHYIWILKFCSSGHHFHQLC